MMTTSSVIALPTRAFHFALWVYARLHEIQRARRVSSLVKIARAGGPNQIPKLPVGGGGDNEALTLVVFVALLHEAQMVAWDLAIPKGRTVSVLLVAVELVTFDLRVEQHRPEVVIHCDGRKQYRTQQLAPVAAKPG